MELTVVNNIEQQIVAKDDIVTSKGNFIEANTKQVTLSYLENDTIIPVFSKDNETTISHAAFIKTTQDAISMVYQNYNQAAPNIRISHTIKGRTPSAIGKPVKELLPNEKTIYYERMAFMIEIPELKESVNGNNLSLVIGGVRAYNRENLYSKKSIEKFQVFIGYQNLVCTNLCISTDGFKDEMRVTNTLELHDRIEQLLMDYDHRKHLGNMERMSKFHLTTEQVAHLIGKMKLYQYLDSTKRNGIFPIGFNDTQVNTIAKSYYQDKNFHLGTDGMINLWNLYNLFTGSVKSSYIDSFLQREKQAYEFIQELVNSLQNEVPNWYLHSIT